MMDNLALLGMAPVLNVQLLLDGLLIGAVFVLSAYGLALVWGVMNVKNLAQGDYVMMGGYIAVVLTNMGIHPIWGLPVAIVVMFAFGWALYPLIIRRVIGRDLFTSLLATFGIAIVVQQLLNIVFGPEVMIAESGFETRSYLDDGVTIADIKLVSLILVVILAIAVVLFMKKSRMGQAIRATSQNARAARIMGIDTDRVYAFTYALNASICGASGVLISMIWVIQPYFGITYSVRAFVIVTASGLGNLPGVIATGLGLGVLEQFGGFILGAEFQQAIVVGLLLLILGIRQIQQLRSRQVVQ
jgi:branched-chain amino acid transport system permease protein